MAEINILTSDDLQYRRDAARPRKDWYIFEPIEETDLYMFEYPEPIDSLTLLDPNDELPVPMDELPVDR